MPTVRIDDPARMNVLGLFLAASLERNLVGRAKPCALRGALTVIASGMRATVRFDGESATVTRAEESANVTLSAPLHRFVGALVRPGLFAFLRIKVRGNPFFALRAMRYLGP